eukprot:996735_1
MCRYFLLVLSSTTFRIFLTSNARDTLITKSVTKSLHFFLSAKKREDATKECAEQGLQFMLYHKRQYMGSGQYIKEWNHYRDFVRCNNQLENKNGIINRLCGSHPFLFEFQYLLAQYYNDEYIAYDQFIKHGATNKRHKREILKNKLLIRAWDFIDKGVNKMMISYNI